MELTNELVELCGFKRINNSMWRLGDITLQNGHICKGKTIYERTISTKKAYRVCFKGRYVSMISDIFELLGVKELNKIT